VVEIIPARSEASARWSKVVVPVTWVSVPEDGVWVQVAETGLEGSVGENARDLTRVNSNTLAPVVRAWFRRSSSNSERTFVIEKLKKVELQVKKKIVMRC
jgi:hypothetical protein